MIMDYIEEIISAALEPFIDWYWAVEYEMVMRIMKCHDDICM